MTQCHRLSLCVLGGRRHVIHAAEAVDGLPVREDVLRAPDPRVSAQLGVKRVASLDGGQLRRLAGRRMIGVDTSAGGGYTVSRSIPPQSAGVSGRAVNLGSASSFICPTFERCSPAISSMLRPVESCSLLTFKAFRSISVVKSSLFVVSDPLWVLRCSVPRMSSSFSVIASCRYSLCVCGSR